MTLSIGNQIQLGLMALYGYFDSTEWAGVPVGPFEPTCDWIVEIFELTGDKYYPYRVSGINLNCKPGEYGHRFVWDVASLGYRYGFPCEST